MNVKEYLKQIELFDEMINQKQEELDSLRAMMEGPGGIDYSKDKVQTSPCDSLSACVTRREELQAEINMDIDHFVELKNRVINQIHGLQDVRYVRVLHQRYIRYDSLEQIALDTGYSYDRIRHVHTEALNAFRKKYHIF